MFNRGCLAVFALLVFCCEEKSTDRRITLVLGQPKKEAAAQPEKKEEEQQPAQQKEEKSAPLPQPPIVGISPKPKPAGANMSYLRANLDALKASMREKGLLPGDPAPIVQSVERLDHLVGAGRLDEADRELTRCLDMLAKFKFTEEFIEKKMERLDRLSKQGNTSAEVDEQIAALLTQANQYFLAGSLEKTNRVLNDIYGLITQK